MNSHSDDIRQLGLGLSDRVLMQRRFQTAAKAPRYLVSHNSGIVQSAYRSVPADVWGERCLDLTTALQASRSDAHTRRTLVTLSPAGMSARVDQLVDIAFIEKYEQLMPRVLLDFEDFYPYKIHRTNEKLMVFARLSELELVEYVLRTCRE